MAAGKKRQKLSTKFALTCILPASALLIAVCCLSLMLTSKNLIRSIKNTLKGQADSKTATFLDTLDDAFHDLNFEDRAADAERYLNTSDIPELKDTLFRLSRSTYSFDDVSLYDFGTQTAYSDNSVWHFNAEPVWYDEERFQSGSGYFKAQNITLNDQLPFIYYVYPFSSPGSDCCDRCFVASAVNKVIFRQLELNMTIPDAKWMILSDEGKIIYHSKGYKREVFEEVEKNIKEKGVLSTTNEFLGRMMVMHEKQIPQVDNIRMLYVIPVGDIISDSNANLILMIILTVLSIGILVFFVCLFTRKMVNEINAIRKGLEGIHEKKFIEAVNATQDEMGDLVDDFNKVIKHLTHQAEHDENTGFYNARSFAENAHKRIAADESGGNYAIIRADIDNFSFINDIFDWKVGNEILVKISEIISDVFSNDSMCGYLGNDIFVVLYRFDEEDYMFKLVKMASDRIKKCDDRIHLIPHFGITEDVNADTDISVACDYAGVALKTIKGNMLREFALYDDEFKKKHNIQKYVESNKQTALDNRDFFIQLQPKCDVRTGEIVGAEALVRWKRSDTGEIIPPGKFIHIFEKNGFIIKLDFYVWEETCKVIKKWQDAGYREIPVSVNVSRMHINNPRFVSQIYALVRKYGIDPSLLEIEITESALLEKGDSELETVMHELKNRGFRLLMDDFASGYSSLVSLQKLPFDVIKIDKALIDNIEEPSHREFVAGAVDFLLKLGKEIVVEGVENETQKDILAESGCTVIQGFCFSQPVGVDEFERLAFPESTEVVEVPSDIYDDDPLSVF